ncbi:MAG: M1 family peptidase, partial [Candidatus Aminicenantes bacterium]|nr:M1 family peptidase [Candidatus Aminicenantes bacterium]
RKTWVFEAGNVRDFAFASSRKFIWDALASKFGDRTVLNMSFYPKEGNPLWEQYSTRAVAHAVETYSRFTFDYPYPVAISVLSSSGGGMEYPMVSFNGGRPEPDGTYSRGLKFSLIGVIIHEVGHNFFPMIVNSDERQWAWMDEGLNSFMEYLAEQEWDRKFGEREAPAYQIADYMKGDKAFIDPIMTDADIDLNLGANAYAKTAAGLNILRETVLGRDLFDFAFKTYARRWRFKHPTPADFFRTMEDATGVDLDWFWRGWFFGTDHVDLAIDEVRWLRAATGDPKKDKAALCERETRDAKRYISNIRNAADIAETAVEKDAGLRDFYDQHGPDAVTPADEKEYRDFLTSLTPGERKLIESGANYYEVGLANLGSLVMPVILKFTYEDGSESVERIPVEIWRRTPERVSKVFVTKKSVRRIELDPFLETADVDRRNNRWAVDGGPDFFKVVKDERPSPPNEMQRAIKK